LFSSGADYHRAGALSLANLTRQTWLAETRAAEQPKAETEKLRKNAWMFLLFFLSLWVSASKLDFRLTSSAGGTKKGRGWPAPWEQVGLGLA
jgi:hypothetical protein